ncbi:MAG: retropepsin-like aspartic protease [Methylocystis sp.]
MRVFFLLALLASLVGANGAGAQSRSVVSMTLTQGDYGGGRIYLPVRFGNVMGAMRLDTGASTTRLRLAPWNKDLPALSKSLSAGATGQSSLCEDVEAKNVALKAEQGSDIARGKYDVSRCASGDGDDLLGLDFFNKARFTLDFGRREMVFFGAPLGGQAKPFRLIGQEKRLVGLELRAGNVASVGLFDTGAEVSAVDLAFVRKNRKLFAPAKGQAKASEAGGKKFSSRLYKIKTLDLGEGRVVHDVYALVYDFGALRAILGRDTPFILGVNLISQFTWELNLQSPDAPLWDATRR